MNNAYLNIFLQNSSNTILKKDNILLRENMVSHKALQQFLSGHALVDNTDP